MLLAGGLDSADDDEARALVKTHRGCGTGFDLSHHCAVTGALRSLDERREQASAETAPSRGGREVDRILHSTGVPLVSLPGGSDGEALSATRAVPRVVCGVSQASASASVCSREVQMASESRMAALRMARMPGASAAVAGRIAAATASRSLMAQRYFTVTPLRQRR